MAYLLTGAGLGTVIREMEEEHDGVEGFDTLVLTRLVRENNAQDVRNMIDLGASPAGYPHMYCTQRDANRVGCQKYEGRYIFQGVLDSEKPYKVRARGYSEKQSANPAVYPGQSDPVPLEGNQGLVGLVISYVALLAPTLGISGTLQSPPVSVATPGNIWSSIVSPIHTYPYGWVLDSREYDEIPGSPVALVTDSYVYYHRYKPGGGS